MSSELSSEQLHHLCKAAMQAAQEAGQWIEQFDRSNLQRTFKDTGSSDASQIVTEVDIRSEEIIRHCLEKISMYFNIAFVGEESSLSTSSNSSTRFEKPYFWCVDPLDGTLSYAEGGAGYAVSIGLVKQSGEPLIGVVYDPVSKSLLHAIKGHGSYRNSSPYTVSNQSEKTLQVYADASFKTHVMYEQAIAVLEKCAHTLCLDDVSFCYGSGAVKNACHVLDSSQACYLKLPKKESGGGSIWDYAATACLANETQAWVSNAHGRPLVFNGQSSTFMNKDGVLYASNKQIANYLIGAL